MPRRTVFGVAATFLLTALYACWCRAPLIWDGAYQFNATLIQQFPYFYLTRFHTFLLWWPTVWASRLFDNLTLLQSVYGLPFLLAPVAGLLLSWWIVRWTAPHLILWAIFAMAAGSLPGQIFVINDSIFQLHLFWPILLGILVPLNRAKRVVMGLLCIFQFVHPLGAMLFAIAAAGAEAIAIADPSRRWLMHKRALIMLGLCLLIVAKVWITNRIPALQDTYATEEAKMETAMIRWYAGVSGWPLRGLACMWAAATLALLYARPRMQWGWQSAVAATLIYAGVMQLLGHMHRHHPLEFYYTGSACTAVYLGALLLGDQLELAMVCGFLILLTAAGFAAVRYINDPLHHGAVTIARCLCAASIALVIILSRTRDLLRFVGRLILLCMLVGFTFWVYWASDGALWWKAIDYRRWVGPLTAPFFLLAIIEALLNTRTRPDTALAAPEELRPVRPSIAKLLAITFAMVLGLQCTLWHVASAELMASIDQSSQAIVPERDVAWIYGTPLDHWATGDYVMAMQGKQPRKLLLDPRSEERIYERPPKVPHWDFYPNPPDPTPRPQGWYDLRQLLKHLPPPPTTRPAIKRLDIQTTPN